MRYVNLDKKPCFFHRLNKFIGRIVTQKQVIVILGKKIRTADKSAPTSAKSALYLADLGGVRGKKSPLRYSNKKSTDYTNNAKQKICVNRRNLRIDFLIWRANVKRPLPPP